MSKAFARSKNATAVGVLLSKFSYIVFEMKLKASLVPLDFMNPNCFSLRILFFPIKSIILLYRIFSKILAMFEIKDIGL